ncbi:hypothetical protein [Streptomyces sp. OspMP-M43]|uniref:hypothetical protein n=1 Tax=Streptomyces sp. OspMP-M43 TaxID=1839781 RepID=UPI00081AFDE0|nr:hypothetical protein [Streptomyces sp. OspMP-M43]SCE42978.1 hypothetical protein GA0115261_105331 [Streptomyces sp. OspMP-M43]
MSAGAASAAVLDHPLPNIFGNSVDGSWLPGQRNALRSVPAAGKPDGEGLEDPLRLGRAMRLRLRDAVQALLADPSIDGLKDAPKLAAVVLYAKARAPKGEKNDNQTSIWGAELGRWLGVKESTVHHKVLPVLRGTDALHTQVVTDAKGHPTGLDCLVMPLWNARKRGRAAHPLALTKAELATLLHLCEALFGHGWTPKDKEPTPPGLLAGRTGKGAATDRLGLLLMVLNTRASGWLQLVGGSVKKREGRAAATLAQLLGCSPSGARKVLARLTEAGVVARQRKSTSTRMNGRGQVMLLPVARAYGRTLAPVEAAQSAGPVFSARPDGACGDHGPAGAAGALGASGICGAEGAGGAVDQERPDGAELHADHAHLVTSVFLPQLDGGFSGEGRGGEGRRPERVRAGEGQAAADASGVAGSSSPVAEGGPLRGEQPKESPVVEDAKNGCGPVAGGSERVLEGEGQGRQQRGRAALPSLDLRAVLAPVKLVWARLESRGARCLVETKVRAELTRVTGFAGSADAPQILANRLARRLENQMQLGGPITDPVGWLIGRGLPQIRLCAEPRCDEGTLLDSGRDCPRCEDRQADSRATRHAVAAAVDAAMPGASETERRAATDRQLHETVTARAWAQAAEWRQYRAQKAEAKAARAEAAAEQPTGEVPAAPAAPVILPAPRAAAVAPALKPETADVDDDDQELVLDDLTPDQVRNWRVRAMKDHSVVFDHIDRYSEPSARRLFSNQLVDQAQHLSGLGHLNLSYSTWGQS